MLLPLFNTVIADDLMQMIGSLSLLFLFLLYTAIRRPSRFRERNVSSVMMCLASGVYAFASYSNSNLDLPATAQLALSYIPVALMLLFLCGVVLLTLWHFIVFKYIRHGAGVTFGIDRECVLAFFHFAVLLFLGKRMLSCDTALLSLALYLLSS